MQVESTTFGIMLALLKSRAPLAERLRYAGRGAFSAGNNQNKKAQRGDILMQNTKLELNISRRSFGRGMLGAMLVSGLGMMDARSAIAEVKPNLNEGDIAVLQFLAAAELVESDLWGQYSELASNNSSFRR